MLHRFYSYDSGSTVITVSKETVLFMSLWKQGVAKCIGKSILAFPYKSSALKKNVKQSVLFSGECRRKKYSYISDTFPANGTSSIDGTILSQKRLCVIS